MSNTDRILSTMKLDAAEMRNPKLRGPVRSRVGGQLMDIECYCPLNLPPCSRKQSRPIIQQNCTYGGDRVLEPPCGQPSDDRLLLNSVSPKP